MIPHYGRRAARDGVHVGLIAHDDGAWAQGLSETPRHSQTFRSPDVCDETQAAVV